MRSWKCSVRRQRLSLSVPDITAVGTGTQEVDAGEGNEDVSPNTSQSPELGQVHLRKREIRNENNHRPVFTPRQRR
jgi:hypothetical protein